MIHGVYSNKTSFKSVPLEKGLNVIVAERTDSDNKTKTINSRGKSTFVSIINFCLGSTAARSGLCIEELNGWSFSIDISLFNSKVLVTREIDTPSRILVKGDFTGWPILPETEEGEPISFFPLDKWKQILKKALFDLPNESKLSVRSMLSYFIRSGSDAYTRPLKFFASQADNQAHIYNAFFVGLDPKYALEWVALDKQGKALKALNDAIDAGLHETQGELESKKIELADDLKKSKEILSSFKVHEQYKEIQIKANELTIKIHMLTNKNMISRRKLEYYQSSIVEEKAPDRIKVEKIFNEVGVLFPEKMKNSIDEANDFHEKVITNRRHFLEAEITQISSDIIECEEQIEDLTTERAEKMKILKTHGALEEYSVLQESSAKISEKYRKIEETINEIKDRNKKKKEIKSAKLALDQKASIDYEEKRKYWEQAIRIFNSSAEALYGESGEFVINISEKGYQFKVNIPGGKGSGIGKMETFCYDITNICMQNVLGREMDFLVHDSIIYDGVDQRQIAHAIEKAAEMAEKYDFQYIMTINSDQIPYNDFSENFNFDEYIKRSLTDENESGSLLGIRY